MNKYKQTAADLDGYEQPDPESAGEMIAGAILAGFIAFGLLMLALEWWS